jgi:hypothetical protein
MQCFVLDVAKAEDVTGGEKRTKKSASGDVEIFPPLNVLQRMYYK